MNIKYKIDYILMCNNELCKTEIEGLLKDVLSNHGCIKDFSVNEA